MICFYRIFLFGWREDVYEQAQSVVCVASPFCEVRENLFCLEMRGAQLWDMFPDFFIHVTVRSGAFKGKTNLGKMIFLFCCNNVHLEVCCS